MGTKDDKSYKTRTRYLIVLIIYIQCYLPGRKEEKEESFNLLERVRLMILVLSYAEIPFFTKVMFSAFFQEQCKVK